MTIIKFAREAGAQTEREPPSAGLLNNFCTADQFRTWFPKKSNPASRIRAVTLRHMFDKVRMSFRNVG